MTESSNEPQEEPLSGPVIPPEKQGDSPPVPDNVLALISNYTERPDLLIESVERHDPGFIKRMTRNSEESAKRTRDIRFH